MFLSFTAAFKNHDALSSRTWYFCFIGMMLSVCCLHLICFCYFLCFISLIFKRSDVSFSAVIIPSGMKADRRYSFSLFLSFVFIFIYSLVYFLLFIYLFAGACKICRFVIFRLFDDFLRLSLCRLMILVNRLRLSGNLIDCEICICFWFFVSCFAGMFAALLIKSVICFSLIFFIIKWCGDLSHYLFFRYFCRIFYFILFLFFIYLFFFFFFFLTSLFYLFLYYWFIYQRREFCWYLFKQFRKRRGLAWEFPEPRGFPFP